MFESDFIPPKKAYKLRLKEIRKKAKLNQTDTAKIISTTQKQYSRWETGDYEIPLRELTMLALFFNCKMDYILGFSDDDTPLFTDEERLNRIKKMKISPHFNRYGLWPVTKEDVEYINAFNEFQRKAGLREAEQEQDEEDD